MMYLWTLFLLCVKLPKARPLLACSTDYPPSADPTLVQWARPRALCLNETDVR